LFSLDSFTATKLENFDGVKILLKQDDFHRFSEVSDFIVKKKIDAVFTLVPTSEVSKVYRLGGVPSNFEVIHMLAGYVTPHMRKFFYSDDRPIDIGYRGSIMPLSFGRLCYEKRKIGDDVSRLLRNRVDLHLDISSRWEDRLGGTEWYTFLKRCKAVLGVESGAGVFDLDGSLHRRCQEIESKIGPFRLDHEYAELYLKELADYDGNVKYFAISPRHFEAIACGAVQILFPGDYTGRMIAGRHYFELRRDYENLEEILAGIKDGKVRKEVATRAFEEVLLDKRNWIEGFVEELDLVITRQLNSKGVSARKRRYSNQKSDSVNALLVQAHEYGSDPRRDRWIPEFCGGDLSVNQLVIDRSLTELHIEETRRGNLVIALPLIRFSDERLSEYGLLLGIVHPVLTLLNQLRYLADLPDLQFAKYLGASPTSARLGDFRWYIKYILDTTATLLEGFKSIRGVDVVIAVNLPTLAAAVVAKDLYGVPIVYEALEYWPEVDPDSEQFEIDFWVSIEASLVRNVDYCNTVSPGLAEILRARYGAQCGVLPNCCPVDDRVDDKRPATIGDQVRFIYQGSFAPHRGLEELINAFANDGVDGRLYLRGRDNSYKNHLETLAKSAGVYGEKVFFLDAVSPEALIHSAFEAGDVGVIPYKAIGENYRNCSPNKLGQYLAAGLPILANDTKFVSDIVQRSGAGVVVDFSDHKGLVLAIQKLCSNNEQLLRFASGARKFFLEYYNWENLSRDFYKKILELAKSKSRREYDNKGFVVYQFQEKSLFGGVRLPEVPVRSPQVFSEVPQTTQEGLTSRPLIIYCKNLYLRAPTRLRVLVEWPLSRLREILS
jgi:glycosyltransferase involved in cell wall biosynthesis